MTNIVWTPTPRQTLALSTKADHILFGGSRGGGKTDAAIHWFLYDIDNPDFRGLVIRKNATDLTDFTDRANKVWKHYGGRKTGQLAVFKFPSGAIVYTGHLADKDSYTRYQGHEYQKMLIEEITHIPTRELFEKLLGSLRSTIPGIKAQLMSNTNPGGAGHEWVKQYWGIESKPHDTVFEEDGVTKIYIPARIEDNKHLALADPTYVKWLQNLPLDLRKKWYEGSWEDIDTKEQYYAAALTRAKQAGRVTRIPIEPALRTFAAFDLGMKDQMTIWVWQTMGLEIRIIGFFSGRNLPIKPYSDALKKFEQNNKLDIETIFLPHDSQVRSMTSDTAMTRYEKFEKLGWNCQLIPNVSLEDGIEQTRELLGHCFFSDVEEEEENYEGIEGIRSSMKYGMRALRSYKKEFDEKMNRYKNTPLHDWASDPADAFRYLSLGNGTIKKHNTVDFSNQSTGSWQKR